MSRGAVKDRRRAVGRSPLRTRSDAQYLSDRGVDVAGRRPFPESGPLSARSRRAALPPNHASGKDDDLMAGILGTKRGMGARIGTTPFAVPGVAAEVRQNTGDA